MGVETKTASGLFVICEGKFLLLEDGSNDFLKIPVGIPRFGESFESNAERQLFEWTGYKGTAKKALPDYVVENWGSKWIIKQYLGDLEETPMSFGRYTHHGQNILWVPAKEIRKGIHRIAPNIQYVLEAGDLNGF